MKKKRTGTARAVALLAKTHRQVQRGLANLVVSLRLNTFTKIELDKWLDEPFTPPPEQVGEE